MEPAPPENVAGRAGLSADASARRAPAPPGVALLRFVFGVLGRITPSVASRMAYRLWFTTRRFTPSTHEREILAGAERVPLKHAGKPIAVYAWGRGPVVLMVHGWHGYAGHFADFVPPLTEAGFRVVAFDAPAHGETPGKRTTVYEIVDTMTALAGAVGPLRAVVAHSFGVLCTTYALAQGLLMSERFVGFSPPSHMSGLFTSFSQTLGLAPGVRERVRGMLERNFGADIWQRFSPENHARQLSIPALILHDVDDRAVPIEEGEALARAWKGARFVRTGDLGHRRILSDPEIIRQAVAFIRE